MVARIKKNDTVVVISGRDKGKKGTVIEVKRKKGQLLAKDIAVTTRHVKPRRAGEQGSIKKEEAYISESKVMPVCTACKKPTRVGSKMLDAGKRVRICVRCKEIF
jgi:large subunit ribosomal protein L24